MTLRLTEYILSVAVEIDPVVGKELVEATREFEEISTLGKSVAQRREDAFRRMASSRKLLLGRAIARLKEETRPRGEEVPVDPAYLAQASRTATSLGFDFDPSDYLAINGQGIFFWLPYSGKWAIVHFEASR